jgi:hypothetical protein
VPPGKCVCGRQQHICVAPVIPGLLMRVDRDGRMVRLRARYAMLPMDLALNLELNVVSFVLNH